MENCQSKISKIFKMLFVGVLLFSCSLGYAQSRHEYFFDAGSGMYTLSYSTNAGKQKNRFGWHAGLGYEYFLADEWCVGTGIQFIQFASIFDLSNFTAEYNAIDMDGDGFLFRSRMDKYQEKQRLLQVQIPLMIQYQTGTKIRFYSAAGAKMGLPLLGKYSNTGGKIINSGYYAEEHYEYTTQRFMGFGEFNTSGNSGKMNLKTAYSLSLEIGVKLNMGPSKRRRADRWAIYTGLYFDYGLNNIARTNKNETPQHFVEYKPNQYDYKINSMLGLQLNDQLITETIRPIAVGVKVKVAFGRGTTLTRSEYPLFRRLPYYR